MQIEIVGFECSRIEAIKAYREIILPMMELKAVKVIVDSIEKGHPIPLDIDKKGMTKLIEAGFIIEFPTRKEVKQLMSQLIQRFLKMGKKKRLFLAWHLFYNRINGKTW